MLSSHFFPKDKLLVKVKGVNIRMTCNVHFVVVTVGVASMHSLVPRNPPFQNPAYGPDLLCKFWKPAG